MGKKHARRKDERYAQLRLLIERAKEDAANWGTEAPKLLHGIREKTVHDFDIYDQAFRKFVHQRREKQASEPLTMAATGGTENPVISRNSEGEAVLGDEHQLKRIADALEQLVEHLQKKTH